MTLALPEDDDQHAIFEEAERRRISLETLDDFRWSTEECPPTLFLGYGQLPEPAIPAAVNELARAVHAARTRSRTGRPAAARHQ